MKCKQCGNEINKDTERQCFNNKYGGKPTYDEMGYGISQICLECIEANTQKLVNEAKRYAI